MTDTDLITADSSAENGALPLAVTTDAPAAPARRGGALTSMVLPELRTLAKEIGVEGASGMRKGELIAEFAPHQSTEQQIAEVVNG